MIIDTINALICKKNKISFILFDKNFKILEFNDTIEAVVDDKDCLIYGDDIRELIWTFVGLEDDIQKLLTTNNHTVHIPMIEKNNHYYDLDIELFSVPEGEQLFIAYFLEKSKQSLEYISMIKAINKKTLIYETTQQNKQNIINKNLLIFHVDLDGNIVEASEALLLFLDLSKEKILGTHFSTFFHTRENNIAKENMIFTALNTNNEIVFFHANIIPLSKNNTIYENMIICQDITYLQQVKRDLEYVSELDSLTGIVNRDFIFKEIDRTLDAKESFFLTLINIKNFKNINDTYGFHAGDMLLKYITKLLENLIRKDDTLARVGGDEFMILFKTEQEEFKNVLQRLKLIQTNNYLQYSQEDQIKFELTLATLQSNEANNPKDFLHMLEKKIIKSKH